MITRIFGIVVATMFVCVSTKAQSDNGRDYVDLGLKVKWATCNIGATRPEEYGDYIAWGEIEPKGEYTLFSYFDTANLGETYRYYHYQSGGHQILEKDEDAAHERWGKNWRLPSNKEQDELREKCTWKWTQLNGVGGYEVTGPNGNSIFLPAAGYRYDYQYNLEVGNVGVYWSRSLSYNHSGRAMVLDFNPKGVSWQDRSRYLGCSIRPVYVGKEQKK